MPHATIDTPIGRLTLIAGDDGLRGIRFATEPARVPADDSAEPDHPVLVETARQLGEYFAGERQEFDLPLRPAGTAFQLAAWRALTTIPYGRTVSYGEQARRLGHAGRARAVGAANGSNPLPIVVPCHRVIGADGSLTGFGGGLEKKAWLLDHERRVAGETLPFS
jgi:methylated-DNA-[protein]-cysteine S-methyltransferase